MIKIDNEKDISAFTEGIVGAINDAGSQIFFSTSDTIDDYKEGLNVAENKIDYINSFISEHLDCEYLETEWFIKRELKHG